MGPEVISAIVILAAKYGPELVIQIIALFKKETVSIADIETLFGSIKPYEELGIPEIAPTATAPAK